MASDVPGIPRVKVSDDDLMQHCIKAGILTKVRSGVFTPQETRRPSRSIAGGISVVTRYFLFGAFVCATHELLTKEGSRQHFHFTEAVIDSVLYHSRELTP